MVNFINTHRTMMNISKTFYSLSFVLLLLTALASTAVSAADIKVSIDRQNIELNESFTLIFEATEEPDDDPDFSPLENDFQVLNKSTSSNISIINGQYTKSLRWNVSLIATKEGTLTIPAIHFGSDSSQPYQITINPVQKSSTAQGAEFISELEINTHSAYPQSQVVVTQRLLSSRNINGYEFSQLKTSGVKSSIQALGEIKQFQTKRGDTPYLVLEQSFALYPQTSGTLTIEPSIASARLSIANRNVYDPFRSNTKTVRRASDKKIVTVKPVPASFKGKHWLPAREVQLVEEFPESTEFKIGEPITRTLSLLADGQTSSQLPEFAISEIANLKQYPDKPLLNDNKQADGITGIQQIKVALIPTRAGSYTLPAISIPWWNTRTNKLQTAKIPARTFTVGAASLSAPVIQLPLTTTDIEPAIEIRDEDITETPGASSNPALTSTNNQQGNLLWKLISLLLLLGWLVTAYLYLKQRNINKPAADKTDNSTPSLKQALKALDNACNASDPHQCKDALLLWGNALFTDQAVHSLGELASRVNQPLGDKINKLNSALYKNNDNQWQCESLPELCRSFATELQQKNSIASKDKKLEDLYK